MQRIKSHPFVVEGPSWRCAHVTYRRVVIRGGNKCPNLHPHSSPAHFLLPTVILPCVCSWLNIFHHPPPCAAPWACWCFFPVLRLSSQPRPSPRPAASLCALRLSSGQSACIPISSSPLVALLRRLSFSSPDTTVAPRVGYTTWREGEQTGLERQISRASPTLNNFSLGLD